MTVNAKLLSRALKQADAATHPNKNLPLGGVSFKILSDCIELVGTEGNQLVLRRIPAHIENTDLIGMQHIIMNAAELAKYLTSGKNSEYAEMLVSDKELVFCNVGDTSAFITMLMFSQYPHYEGIISNYSDKSDFTPNPAAETITIGLNRNYLKTLLQNMTKTKTETIEFKISTPINPVYLTNRGSTDGVKELDILRPIMPRN